MSEAAEESTIGQSTAEIIQLHPTVSDEKCSFCGTPKSKAKKMISNKKGKNICDKCIMKGLAIVRGENHVSN